MKRFLLILTIICIFLITGCEPKNEKVMNCSRTINQSNIKVDLSYDVTYKGTYVIKVISLEKIISDDISTLNKYKEQIDKQAKNLNNIEYYEHKVTINGNTLVSYINIDYSKIDMNELTKIDPSMKNLIKNGKILVKDIESLYNQLGITCEK